MSAEFRTHYGGERKASGTALFPYGWMLFSEITEMAPLQTIGARRKVQAINREK